MFIMIGGLAEFCVFSNETPPKGDDTTIDGYIIKESGFAYPDIEFKPDEYIYGARFPKERDLTIQIRPLAQDIVEKIRHLSFTYMSKGKYVPLFILPSRNSTIYNLLSTSVVLKSIETDRASEDFTVTLVFSMVKEYFFKEVDNMLPPNKRNVDDVTWVSIQPDYAYRVDGPSDLIFALEFENDVNISKVTITDDSRVITNPILNTDNTNTLIYHYDKSVPTDYFTYNSEYVLNGQNIVDIKTPKGPFYYRGDPIHVGIYPAISPDAVKVTSMTIYPRVYGL